MAYIAKIKDTANTTGFVTTSLYGTCSTAAGTAPKVVACEAFDKLIVGATIRVKFDAANTAANPTLNVNSTGAKDIQVYGTFASPTKPSTNDVASWMAGEVVEFIYLENTVSGTTTGYWLMTNSHAMFTTTSIGSASAGTAFSIPNLSSSDLTVKSVKTNTSKTIHQWTFADVTIPNVTGVTAGTAASMTKTDYTLTYSSVTIPNVTGNTDVTIPNVTGNADVTVVKSATISEGVLSFGTDTASKVTLGTALTASKVTLGTALSASKITAPTSGTKWTYITAWTTNTPTAVTLGTALTASKATAADDISASLIVTEDKTVSKVTAGTAFTVPNISVSTVSNVIKKR